MKKKYLGLAVTATLAFSMLATSAFAINDADLLDGLDSTDFALATHAHSTSDVTGLDAELAAKADQTYVDAELATNTNLIKRIVRIAKELNREIATPDETRAILGLSK